MQLVTPSVPGADQLAAIRELVAERSLADGRDPLSDQALTQLSSAEVEHVVAIDDAHDVSGYAQLDGNSLEIVADSDVAAQLLRAFAGRHVLVWSHGKDSPLPAALRTQGFLAQRELHQLRRPLTDAIEVPPTPAGIDIRPFTVGGDEDAWLQVNSAAFADHAEQGGWTRADLDAREGAAWFDPSGFLLAWRGANLLGFHWTKIHPGGAGEVYVIGIDPAAQGLGLGKVLLHKGLSWLHAQGCAEVLLYVDGSNTAAMRLYENTGFVRHDLDVQWGRP